MGYPVFCGDMRPAVRAVGRNRFIAPLFLPSRSAQLRHSRENAHGYCALPHDKMRPGDP